MVPVVLAVCRWLLGICGHCSVETAVAVAVTAAAAAGEVTAGPLGEPKRENNG